MGPLQGFVACIRLAFLLTECLLKETWLFEQIGFESLTRSNSSMPLVIKLTKSL